MSYQVYFPESGKRADAVVVGLEVHFSHGVGSIRMRSTQTAVSAIKRAYPEAAIYAGRFERGRFGSLLTDRRIA